MPVAPAEQHNLRKQLELGKKKPGKGKGKSVIVKKPAKTRKAEHGEEAEEGGPYNAIVRWLPEGARPMGRRGKHSYTSKKKGCRGRIKVLSRPAFWSEPCRAASSPPNLNMAEEWVAPMAVTGGPRRRRASTNAHA